MINTDKILHDAALYLGLIARLIDDGAPLESVSKQLREVNVSLDDALVSDLTDEQDKELDRLYSVCRALEKAAFSAKKHWRSAYLWVSHPRYGWVIVKFT